MWTNVALDPLRDLGGIPRPLFSLLKNEQVGLIDFWCPASTNLLEYSRGCTLAQMKQR